MALEVKVGDRLIIWTGEGQFQLETVQSVKKTILRTAESVYVLEYPYWEQDFNGKAPKRVERVIRDADLLELAHDRYVRDKQRERLIDFKIVCMKRDKEDEPIGVLHDDHIAVEFRGRKYEIREV